MTRPRSASARPPARQDVPAVTLLGRTLAWLRRIPRRDPATGLMAPYLDRYSARPMGRSGTNEWRAYVHNFLAPDDAGHHNHPCAWSLSIVLRGSYTEEVLKTGGTVCTRRIRWFNWVPAGKFHRITELHPRPGDRGVWTLFLCGPLARHATGVPRGWGFWTPGRGYVPWEVHEAERATAARAAAVRAQDTSNAAAARLATWARLTNWRQN